MKEVKVSVSSVVSKEIQINKICSYFKVENKIGTKIHSSLINVIEKNFPNQGIIIDSDLIISEFKENTFLKKLIWNEEILLEKYGHLIYSQNIRTISTQFKKILIKKCGAFEVKIEKVTRGNVANLLNDILKINDLKEIKNLIKLYALKYQLVLI